MKKRCNRRAVLALPPRGLRPKLRRHDLVQVGLYAVENLDAIATGQAGVVLMWDYCEGVLTWWRVAELLRLGELEMQGQLEVAMRLIERYGSTGAVRFEGQDYQMAKIGLDIMDQLAAAVDTATAARAAVWCTLELAALRARALDLHQVRQQQGQAA
jgi:hypothetical protein